MSTFLALAQAVRRDCAIPGDGPVSVKSQTGILKKIVAWTAEAWVEIQRERRDWRFMEGSQSGSLLLQQTNNAADFGLVGVLLDGIVKDSFYLQSAIEPLTYLDRIDWRASRYGVNPKIARPRFWTVNTSGNVVFDSIPDAAHSFTFEYRKQVQRLTENGDQPYMPEEFERAIIALAVQYYADDKDIPELSRSQSVRHSDAMTDLTNDQTPPVRFAPSRFD